MQIQHAQLQHQPEWMDLRAVQRYACVSERTIRSWIHRPHHPLPAIQVEKGKLLVKRSQLDKWLEAHAYRSVDTIDLDGIVNEVIKGIN